MNNTHTILDLMHPANAKRTKSVPETALTAEFNPYQKIFETYYASLNNKYSVVDSKGNFNVSVKEILKNFNTIFYDTDIWEKLNEINEEAVELKGYGKIEEVYGLFFTRSWVSESKKII